MVLKLVTAEEMQKIDRAAIQERGIPGSLLMERAGRAVAEEILKLYHPERVGIVAGKGNNAGDGLVVARILAERGCVVKLMTLTEPSSLSESGRENYDRLPGKVQILDKKSVSKMSRVFADCEVVVDAILGTGIKGAPRGTAGEAIALLNSLEVPLVSVDIPSGLDADTGLPEGSCVRAHRTITMGLSKLGLIVGQGSQFCGSITVADIGFPKDLIEGNSLKVHLLEWDDVIAALPERAFDGHKGTFGSLVVVAGSQGMSGAAYLTVATALRSGCGMVYAALPASIVALLESSMIEAIKVSLKGENGVWLTLDSLDDLKPFLGKANAMIVGPGLGTDPGTIKLVRELVKIETPMVIDADGLNALGEDYTLLSQREQPTILTPHPGEMGRLLGLSTREVQANRVGNSRRVARESQATILLKGAVTTIATPDGRVFINPTGNSGMAKGGSGDVLTGLIGGFLAQGLSALDAGCAGAYIHGLAGDDTAKVLGQRGMTASDLMVRIPFVLKAAEDKSPRPSHLAKIGMQDD